MEWPLSSIGFAVIRLRGIVLMGFVCAIALWCTAQNGDSQSPPAGAQQTGNIAKLRIKAAIVDSDLNVKPIPKLKLVLRSVPPQAQEIQATTNFDGVAEVDIAIGTYALASVQPLQFQGRQYSWAVNVSVPAEGKSIELSVDNAHIEQIARVNVSRKTDELTAMFQRFKPSIVTVWSEFASGTGFLVDPSGLLLTNQHVIGPSEYIAVQFDGQRKLPAILLCADADKDIAVLWVNLSGIKDVVIAPLVKAGGLEPTVIEGERVFTIGSPMSQRKIMTAGIVSKVEKRAIISDININHGNSGGPLFNSLGYVVGLTTFIDPDRLGGPGLSGIVRIEEAFSLLEAAQQKKNGMRQPSNVLLPVEPEDRFPLDAIKQSLQELVDKKDFSDNDIKSLYSHDAGDYVVTLITPRLMYYAMERGRIEAIKTKEKRNSKQKNAIQGTFQPLEDLQNWREYIGEYRPVLEIRTKPKFQETGGSQFTRIMVSPYLPATMRFKTDFYKMSLKCDSKEIEPIHPGKIARVVNRNNRFENATDATYEGFYTYPADAISSSCGKVTLELFSEKNPNKPKIMQFNYETLVRIVDDFAPYTKDSGSKVRLSKPASVRWQ
ncbi:MAG: serine protease [Candidatus Korobacteraceae bacterium]|jgi:S1-C subfamily serine protease